MVDEKAKTEAAEGTFVYPLQKEVKVHGDLVKELTFREPNGGDIEDIGMPVTFDFATTPPRIMFDAKVMSAMMCRLGTFTPMTVRSLAPKDWSRIAWRLAGFFTPGLNEDET